MTREEIIAGMREEMMLKRLPTLAELGNELGFAAVLLAVAGATSCWKVGDLPYPNPPRRLDAILGAPSGPR